MAISDGDGRLKTVYAIIGLVFGVFYSVELYYSHPLPPNDELALISGIMVASIVLSLGWEPTITGYHKEYLGVKIEDYRHMEDVGAVVMSIGAVAFTASWSVGVAIATVGLAVFMRFGSNKGKREHELRDLLENQQK